MPKKALQAVALWWTDKSWKSAISILDLEGCGDEGAQAGRQQLKANYEENAPDNRCHCEEQLCWLSQTDRFVSERRRGGEE